MKIRTFIRFEIVASVLLIAGCASQPKEKPVQQRGWIGGSYERAAAKRAFADRFYSDDHSMYCFPSALASAQTAGILTTGLGTNTPAFRAGLREGDLILELNHQPVTEMQDFVRIVGETRPGEALPLKAFRKGKTIECNVTAGREKYREGGNITIGLPGFYEPLRLIPTRNSRDFSLVALGYKRDDHSPFEFDSVKEQYRHNCHPKDKRQGYDRDWQLWLAIVQVTKGKTILEQEPVGAAIKD
jgi:hypothetical protein